MSVWRPIDEAPLGKTVLLWHVMWRAPYPGVRNGDDGAVYVDTCEWQARGWQTHASHFAYIDAPKLGHERPAWAEEPEAQPLGDHDPLGSGAATRKDVGAAPLPLTASSSPSSLDTPVSSPPEPDQRS